MKRFTASLAAFSALTIVACSRSPREAAAPAETSRTQEITDNYRGWVLAQADDFLIKTEAFAAAVEAGNDEEARGLYAPARMHYERIEPIAEVLGDLDPRIDAREGDVPDAEWRGYHKLEKLLWSERGAQYGAETAERLVEDVRLLRAQIETADISVAGMITGAVELLNEVSTSKVTGEEERYSRTDLWDFQANVEGAAKIYELLAPEVEKAEPELAQTLDRRFATLRAALDAHRVGDGFVFYGELSAEDVKVLAAAVDGVAEPLSRLGAAFADAGDL